jgi:hypothetical protein
MRMSGRRHGWSTVAGAALVIATGAGSSEAVMAKAFTLAITGAEGARYTGRCTLTTAAGEETFVLIGTVPRREELTGEGLTCRIEAAGLVAVEISHGGSVSRSVTSGGTINIAVR